MYLRFFLTIFFSPFKHLDEILLIHKEILSLLNNYDKVEIYINSYSSPLSLATNVNS